MTVEKRLQTLNLVLPEAAKSIASYVPFQEAGKLLFISGQLPLQDGKLLLVGKCGREINLSSGQQLARQCAVNVLAQLKAACQGNWSRVLQCVKLTVFVAVDPEFTEIAQVANGASELLQAVLGEAGRHSRSAIGVASLPLNAPVEVEAVFLMQ